MKPFPIHFRDHVMPRLHNLVTAEAVCVVQNVESFTGAYYAVLSYARRHGAMMLAGTKVKDADGTWHDGLERLEDWISTTLLVEIDRAERVVGR